jgi:hypothetical protein
LYHPIISNWMRVSRRFSCQLRELMIIELLFFLLWSLIGVCVFFFELAPIVQWLSRNLTWDHLREVFLIIIVIHVIHIYIYVYIYISP